MSASDNGPDGRQQRYQRAVSFLQGARKLPDLTPAQIDRIERHLNRARPLRARRPVLSPALAVLAIVLVAGVALAVTGRSLARRSGIGRRAVAFFAPEAARKTAAAGPGRAATGTTLPAPAAAGPAAKPQVVPVPAAAAVQAPAQAPATAVERTGALATEAAAPGPAIRAPSLPANPPSTLPDVARPARAPSLPSRRRPSPATIAQAVAGPTGQPDLMAAPAAAPPMASAPDDGANAGAGADPGSAPQAAPPANAPATAAPPATAPAVPAADGRGANPAAAPARSEVAEAESPIVAESRSFAAALGRWHRDHDANAALTALDAHERRFPDGEIRLEARLLRAEILLAGGHEREGLALLDPVGLAGLPRARELRTVRGELRIKLGRCADGKTDLDAVIADGVSDALGRRARRALLGCP